MQMTGYKKISEVTTYMDLQKLLSLTRKGIDTYNLINDGDHIAVGVSAGKDSLSLLYAMKHLQRFYPKKYELSAITVDLGLGNLRHQALSPRTTFKRVALHEKNGKRHQTFHKALPEISCLLLSDKDTCLKLFSTMILLNKRAKVKRIRKKRLQLKNAS